MVDQLDIIEFSEELRQPVELYLFETDGKAWRYTNADREFVSDSLGTFEPMAISRSAISQSEELRKLGLKIKAPRTIPLYEHFRVAAPGRTVTLTVYTVHYDPVEYDSEETILAEWTGRVLGPSRSGDQVEFTCEPAYTSVKMMGLRRCWQINCPLVLYGQGLGQCNVNKDDFMIEATVLTIDGASITATEIGTAPEEFYFEGGYMEWEPVIDGVPQVGDIDYRFIDRHEGEEIGLTYTLYGLEVGQTVKLYPGCDHTATMCVARFDNIDNYGGQLYIPHKNPYKGDPVY